MTEVWFWRIVVGALVGYCAGVPLSLEYRYQRAIGMSRIDIVTAAIGSVPMPRWPARF